MADDDTTRPVAADAATGRRPHAKSRTGRARKTPAALWYGATISFQRHLEHGLHDTPEHRHGVSANVTPRGRRIHTHYRVLTYHHAGLDVPGRRHRVPVQVHFYEDPDHYTYGLPAADYPRVVADPGAESKHRMPDGALCLFFPGDPPEKRWQHTDGLVSLFEIVRRHLVLEDYWRESGGFGDRRGKGAGVWLGDEAPHGFPDERSVA